MIQPEKHQSGTDRSQAPVFPPVAPAEEMNNQAEQEKCWRVFSHIKGDNLPSNGRPNIRTEDDAETLSETQHSGMHHCDRHNDNDRGGIKDRGRYRASTNARKRVSRQARQKTLHAITRDSF